MPSKRTTRAKRAPIALYFAAYALSALLVFAAHAAVLTRAALIIA